VSLVAFACMLDVSGIGAYGEFSALIGINIVAFLYSFALILLYSLQPLLSSTPNAALRHLHDHLTLYSLLLDFAIGAMLLSSFIAAAYRCGSPLYINGVSQGIPLCKSETGHNVEAAIGLEFIAFVLFALSFALSWRRLMAEGQEKAANAAAAQSKV
jgi:hypothetical protein